jgi:tetratricopeptide (TPR) repeat protein
MQGARRLALAIALAPLSAATQTPQVWLPDASPIRSLPADTSVDRAARLLRDQPNEVSSYIALARAQAGVRQIREAVATLTVGLARFPESAELYRWRGHRYLSLMEFDRAQGDFDRGLAIDSSLYGIWYHRGVTHFVRGEYDEAVTAFVRARPLAPDSAEFAGSSDWLYTSLVRLGALRTSRELLDETPRIRSVTNAYTRRLDLYRGRTRAPRFMTPADTAPVQLATLSFGLATWAHARGDRKMAEEAYRNAARPDAWPSFAFIAAIADVAALTWNAGPTPPERFVYPDDVLTCVANAPSEQFARTAVHLGLMIPRGAIITVEDRRIRDAVARRLRTAVETWRLERAGTLDSLPHLEHMLDWKEWGGQFLLTAYQDGRLLLEPSTGGAATMPADSTIAFIAELVERARSVAADSLIRSAGAQSDSARFSLFLTAPGQSNGQMEERPMPSVRIVIGSRLAPRMTPVRATRDAQMIGPRYPDVARSQGYEATIIAEAVVDTAGYVVPASIAFLGIDRPSDPRESRILDSFIDNVRSALIRTRYAPAAVAGCKTPQIIKQPFIFNLER